MDTITKKPWTLSSTGKPKRKALSPRKRPCQSFDDNSVRYHHNPRNHKIMNAFRFMFLTCRNMQILWSQFNVYSFYKEKSSRWISSYIFPKYYLHFVFCSASSVVKCIVFNKARTSPENVMNAVVRVFCHIMCTLCMTCHGTWPSKHFCTTQFYHVNYRDLCTVYKDAVLFGV